MTNMSRVEISVTALVGAIIGGLILIAGIHFSKDTRVPVQMERASALNSPLLQGGKLSVRIHRSKVRSDCPVTSLRTAQNVDGEIYNIMDSTWAGGEAGSPYLDYDYDTRALPPGEYVLHVDLLYNCPERSYSVKQPDVRFRVIEGEGT